MIQQEWKHALDYSMVWLEYRYILSTHLESLTMRVRLVCTRRQPCLKVMSNWGADKVMNKRKIWQNVSEIGYTKLTWEQHRKERLLKSRGGGRQFCWDSFTDTVCRENKLDTDEGRQARAWECARRLECTAKVSMRPSTATQEEAKENRIESVILEN